jgi:hexosaminidase
MDRDKLCPARADRGGLIIAEDFFHYYLDYPYAMTPLKKVYTFDPLEGYSEQGKPGVIGVEAPLWTEFIEDFDRLCRMAFPRLLAVAERGWTAEANCDYADFRRRAEETRPLLQNLGISMDPQSDWDPKGLPRLGKLLNHYKRTLTKDMLLSFLSKKDD